MLGVVRRKDTRHSASVRGNVGISTAYLTGTRQKVMELAYENEGARIPTYRLCQEYVSTYILGPTCAYVFYDTSQVCLHNTLGAEIAPNLHLCTRFLRCDPPTGPCSTDSYALKCLHIHFRGVLTFSIQVEKCAYIFQGCLHILSQRRYIGTWVF